MSCIATTLTEAQKQKTLGAKRKKCGHKKSTIRHLLLPPYEPFWPVVDPVDDSRLREVLQELLPAAKKKPISTESSGVLKMPRSKNDLSLRCSNSELEERKTLCGFIICGVNAVSRAVEKCEACGVLLASDVDPLFLNQHVATLCASRGIPVLVAPCLREVTRSYLGFSCIALGLRKVVAEIKENHLSKVQLLIQELSERIQLPLHLQQIRIPQNSESVQTDQAEASIDDISASAFLPGKQEKPCRPISDLYLHRTSMKTREFVPCTKPGHSLSATIIPDNTHDFLMVEHTISEEERESLPLGISHTLVNRKRQASALSYIPFRVKSVKPKPKKKKT